MSTLDEVLAWLADDTADHPDAATLLRLRRLGADDLIAAAGVHGSDPVFAAQLAALEAAGWSGDVQTALDHAATVGARAIVEDPDNLDAWAAVAALFSSHMLDYDLARVWRHWYSPDGRAHHTRSTVELVEGFLDAGRAPSYAMEMLRRAASAGVAPDEFGYAADVAPETLTELVDAGITSRFELGPLLATGMAVADVVAATSRGIAPGALLAALAEGLPREQWDVLVGLPGAWFPTESDGRLVDPVANGMLGRGFTWSDLADLNSRGWGGLSQYAVRYGLSYARGSSVKMEPGAALHLSTIMPLADVARWAKELTTGKYGARWYDPALPPLIGGWIDAIRLAESVAALVEVGVRPSHLATYRPAGCRSVEHIVTAARAGIDVSRAKLLLERHGEKPHSWSPRRIRDLDRLLAAHAAHAA